MGTLWSRWLDVHAVTCRVGTLILILVPAVWAAGRANAAETDSKQRPSRHLVNREVLVADLDKAAGLLAKQDLTAAAAVLEHALSLVENDPGVMFNLAQIYVRTGEKAKALQLMKQLAQRGLGFHPDADAAFASLADLPEYKAILADFEAGEPTASRSVKAFALSERDLFPEGIACDEKRRTLYVGSILKRKVVRVDPDGHVRDVVGPHQDGLMSVLGVKVHAKRRELWAVATGGPEFPEDETRSGLFRFDLRTGALVGKQMLPADVPHNLNDLAIDSRGNAYVTDTATGAIYRMSGSDTHLTEFLPANTFRSPNGIAVSGNDRHLYVASSGRGLSVVNLESKRIATLAAPDDVVTLGIDGMSYYRDSLIAIQNGIGRGRVMRYYLASPTEIEHAELLESRNPLFEVPTTGALCGRDFFYLANTQLDKANDQGVLTPDSRMKDVIILRIRVS